MRRIQEMDSLRGFALAGIVMVNIIQITGMPETRGESADHPGVFAFELVLLQRPFLIFSFLFGISFALFLRTAEKRTDRPRLVLLRRLLFLGLFGAAHHVVQPGEVLKWYAGFGILVLLPASYLSRRWVLGIGIVLLLVSGLTFRGLSWIPGLFLLGMAAARYGLPETLDRRGRQLGIAFGIAAALSVILGVMQWYGGVGPTAHYRSLPAGLAVAALFTFGFLLLLRTPARRPLDAVFAPMGRMALTNYVLATFLILVGDAIWHVGERTDYGRVLLLGVAIGVIQAALSPLWLYTFRYGPLEWVWRCLTWWQIVPIRYTARAMEMRASSRGPDS